MDMRSSWVIASFYVIEFNELFYIILDSFKTVVSTVTDFWRKYMLNIFDFCFCLCFFKCIPILHFFIFLQVSSDINSNIKGISSIYFINCLSFWGQYLLKCRNKYEFFLGTPLLYTCMYYQANGFIYNPVCIFEAPLHPPSHFNRRV